MLAEGVNPALIDNAAAFNGSPMGPLETLDSISIETAYHAMNQRRADVEAAGDDFEMAAEPEVIRVMIEEYRRKGQQDGGVYQCVNAYGLQTFAGRSVELAQLYGEAFEPPKLLLDMAECGETFA